MQRCNVIEKKTSLRSTNGPMYHGFGFQIFVHCGEDSPTNQRTASPKRVASAPTDLSTFGNS